MKHKITLLSVSIFLISTNSFAQKTIEALDIIKDIKEGKSISINNAIIEGVLDFTFMERAFEKMPRKKRSSWFNWNSSNSSNENKKNDRRPTFIYKLYF
jgi:outer membrane protein assembly factor BamA